jgi:hypothetical protein
MTDAQAGPAQRLVRRKPNLSSVICHSSEAIFPGDPDELSLVASKITSSAACIAAVRRGQTGFLLCGMADEPPLPSSAASASSPISVCIGSAPSVASFPSKSLSMVSAEAISKNRSRAVCQAIAGSPNCSRSANLVEMRRASVPLAASVPTAPPNCRTTASFRTLRRASLERIN